MCGAAADDVSIHKPGARKDAREAARAESVNPTTLDPSDEGAVGELRTFGAIVGGILWCLCSLAIVINKLGESGAGLALMFGGVMLLIGGASIYFNVRRLLTRGSPPRD